MTEHKTKVKTLCRRSVLILGLAGVIPVHAAKLPDAQELMQLLRIEQSELARLEQGKAVSFDVAEGQENELAAGVVMYLPASPSKIIQLIDKKGLASIDSDIMAQGNIPVQAALDAFKGFGFKAGSDEAADFLEARPGSEFNLSFEEYKSLRNASSTKANEASQVYQKLLFERWQSYRRNGLKGIATYDRGNGKEANPGGELRAATQANKVLARYFPDLHKAWLSYPAALPAGAEERFFWLNRKVEGRPTAILGHRMTLSAGENGEVILARQFYVGHSYNSNQLSIACLPYREGSLVFYANRNFTDQVAGMGSSLKHSIGREQMKGEIVKRLTNLRKAFK
ncbi:MAG: hypothetical protein ACU83V_04680 [Gammaproteobacteria bacterium]